MHLTTGAIIASLLSAVHPLGRSPSCTVVSAVLTIWGRLGTYFPRALNWGFTLIWLHSCNHSKVERCSSLCCSVTDLFLSKRSPGSGIFQSSGGLYMNELAALTARYAQLCLYATFCVHTFSTECTIKPSRCKLTARSCAGYRSKRIDDPRLIALLVRSDHERVAAGLGRAEGPFIARVMVRHWKIGHAAGAPCKQLACALHRPLKRVQQLPLFGVVLQGIVGTLKLPVPLRTGAGAHGGHELHPPCPKGLGPLVLPIPDPRHPGLVIRVRIRPPVPAHQLSKQLLVLSTPFLNASLRLLLLSLPECSVLSWGNMLIV